MEIVVVVVSSGVLLFNWDIEVKFVIDVVVGGPLVIVVPVVVLDLGVEVKLLGVV